MFSKGVDYFCNLLHISTDEIIFTLEQDIKRTYDQAKRFSEVKDKKIKEVLEIIDTFDSDPILMTV